MDKKILIIEIEKLLNEYLEVINERKREGLLKENTAHTYILHSENFVKWCKGDFLPGERNR